jgi:hypothetical protein
MKKRTVQILIGMIIMCFLAACHMPSASSDISVEDLVATSVQQTKDAESGGGDGDGNGDDGDDIIPPTETATATLTLQPSETATATITLTPTLEKPMVRVSVDTNCRTGPGKIYDWIGALLVGEQAEVVGQTLSGEYWIIKNPDLAGTCWLWANYATVTGPTAALPQFTPPPTPTPAFYWAGSWTTYLGDEGGPYQPYLMSISVDDKDFTGLIDLGGGDYVNLSGTIENDYLSVSGTWTGPTQTGTFAYFAYGANQFQGNYGGVVNLAWCGSRGGGAAPSPCEKY